jgi:hypothetical protein
MQPEKLQQRQQEQPPQPAAADQGPLPAPQQAALQPSGTPGRSRKRSAAAAASTAADNDQQVGAGAAAAQDADQPDVAQLQQQPKRQCKQQLQLPVVQQEDVAAAGVDSRDSSEAQQAAAAAGVEAGTEGHDAALTDVLSMLASISNNKEPHLPASQALAGDMLQLPDTLLSAGRAASGGPSGAGSGGGSGGMASGGQGVRGRRRAAGGLTRASSGGAGSGGQAEVLDGAGAELGAGSSGGSAAVQAGSKRLRRGSGAAAAKTAAGSGGGGDVGQIGGAAVTGMLPPARKAPGVGAAAAAGAAAAGGGRYGTRRSAMSAMPTDAFEPSQQVGAGWVMAGRCITLGYGDRSRDQPAQHHPCAVSIAAPIDVSLPAFVFATSLNWRLSVVAGCHQWLPPTFLSPGLTGCSHAV